MELDAVCMKPFWELAQMNKYQSFFSVPLFTGKDKYWQHSLMSLKTYQTVTLHSKEMLTTIFTHIWKSFSTKRDLHILKNHWSEISLPWRKNNHNTMSVTKPTMATETWETFHFLGQHCWHIHTKLHHKLCDVTPTMVSTLWTCIQCSIFHQHKHTHSDIGSYYNDWSTDLSTS
jgi:hypothetical protein